MSVEFRQDIGLVGISRQRIGDEDHLPIEGKSAPKFQPRHGELEDVLRRPTLDERLTNHLQPRQIDPYLLNPQTLSQTRRDVLEIFESAAEGVYGPAGAALAAAAVLVFGEVEAEIDIHSGLAALFKG
ncbi:hypothetical protein [Labrenzia sp. OB1]|uniref:type III secretion apparatus assembly protein SctX n=1 Tax=Labrenzia sp. OB1 TaxID=1561204 RepID=UPI0007B1BC09|nr:hypothetical protein [Labrenzia sp. OB1]KZM47361.1 hypothetical protein OA90_26430 [Labrenzia sp. OB1]